jgi:hypothetical protein
MTGRKVNETASTPEIGERMPPGDFHAGWIYAGISKTTHQPFYVAPKDAGNFEWDHAMVWAEYEGAGVPSREELDQMYTNRNKGALKGTFNEAGWYWARGRGLSLIFGSVRLAAAWAQNFGNGDQVKYKGDGKAALRFVQR